MKIHLNCYLAALMCSGVKLNKVGPTQPVTVKYYVRCLEYLNFNLNIQIFTSKLFKYCGISLKNIKQNNLYFTHVVAVMYKEFSITKIMKLL